MGCLVILLGFQRPAAADRIDQVLAGLNRNHRAIGQVIPDLHTLEVGRDKISRCPEGGLTDKTIFNVYGSSNYVPEYRSGFYGCLKLQHLTFYDYSERILNLPNSENRVVNIPSKSGHQLGRYFTRQYPELAILGVNIARRPFNTDILDVDLSDDYDGSRPRVERTFQVDSNAVIWEKIPSNSRYAPTVHQLLIAEDTRASELTGKPQHSTLSNGGNRFGMSLLTFVRARPKITYHNFKNFYLVLFGSYSTAIDQNTIENIVRAINTGNPPSLFSVNPNFSFPRLTVNSTTNLPIDVSTAFISSVKTSYYNISDAKLPDGLKFDRPTKSIIVDPNAPLPAGPKRSRLYHVPITVDDGNGNTRTETFDLIVN
ncbi:MAG: hypothetical protein F6K54_29450 [Okeania sp. SIO3B5]|uniref:putative Ig domain-containing protein n=1 Tax=Okeania sp. SIO3B5 TaxID=2607811 RepID=UPI00140056ED|nr:putative Ig domain-containing protein [Okeania sp. SIO3B5]NEO56838.1 hypothetical protein [Okeania sp. SIO3B5]